MTIDRRLLAAVAAAAFVLTACSTGSDTSGTDEADSGDETAAAPQEAADIRIDVITHAAPGDSFWDVVEAGADQAGNDLGVDMQYNSSPEPGQQSTLIDTAVSEDTDGLVVSMASPEGLEASIRAAVDAGVPVITINSGIEESADFGAITHVGQSETLAGEAAGEELNAAGLGNVICVIQEAGNVALEERCAAAASTFDGEMNNLQVDNTDLAASQATIESELQASGDVDGVLSLGGDIAGRAVAAVQAVGSDAEVGTFDVNADVAQLVADGDLLFAIDQQPYVQGYLGVTGIYLKVTNGNDIGGGQPVYSGPAIITEENADEVVQFAENGTR